MVEGLEGGRFALISKTHHAVVDGVSGVDLATVLFDLLPEPPAIEHPDRGWQPAPVPTTVELAARGVRALVRTPLELAGRAAGAATHPRETLATAREAAEGIGELVWAGLNPAPETPLNVPIGPHRRLVFVRCELSDFKTVKNAFGGTVNDVVLTTVAGALRRWLRGRGVRTEGLELRALVPVSVRAKHEHGSMGNRITVMRGPLPVYIEDPVARLRVVKASMDGLKDSKQAVGAEVLAGVQQFAPPTILAQASRLNFSTRLFNLIVTNVPGPQFPLYVLGRRMQDLFPIAFLPKDHALAVAIMSYDGGIDFGLIADYDAVADIDALGEYLEASLTELVTAAHTRTAKDKKAPAAPAAKAPAKAKSSSRPPKRANGAKAGADAKAGSS
jgi:diacylglycerol O-acyltransferase